MALTILLLTAGFIALYYGAEWLVDGASDIASHMKLSKSFIGLTLVAFGTSSPEFFVNVIAAYNGHSQLALSNIVGSNLTNLCLGFGISAAFCQLPVRRGEFGIDLVFMALTPGLVVLSFLATANYLSLWMLIPFGVLLAIYLYSLTRRSAAAEVEDPTHLTLAQPIFYFVLGVIALYVGGEIVYRNAVALAQQARLPESLIGLTIVACGTSIPDVTASIVAARKGEFGISIGNLLGSNISNIFVVLGGTLVVANTSLQGDAGLLLDYTSITLLSCLFAAWALSRQQVTRLTGGLLLLAFFGYIGVRLAASVAG